PAQASTHGDMRALVVRAVVGNLLGTGAQAGHWHDDLELKPGAITATFADERHVVVHSALHARDGRLLGNEVGEVHLEVTLLRLEALRHILQHFSEGFDTDLDHLLLEEFHSSRHLRDLEVVRPVHAHVVVRHGVLVAAAAVAHPYGMADVLDAHLVDGNPARVFAALDIGNGSGRGRCGHLGLRMKSPAVVAGADYT